MRLRYWFIMVLFFFTVGPGLLLFGINKYVMGLLPPVVVPLMIYLLRDEWLGTDWNRLIRDKAMYRKYALALQVAIYAMAIDTLIFHPKVSLTDVYTAKYPIMVFYVVALGPIAEEIFYRKIIYGELAKKLPFWAAAGIASIIFGAAHLSLERFIGYAAVSLIFCYVYRKSGSLAPSILAHSSLNFIAVLVTTLRS